MATKHLVLLFTLALGPFNSWSASPAGYLDNKPMVAHLKELAREHKKFLRVSKVCDTSGKNEVWRVELGSGTDDERAKRPTMLVVAGIEGNDLAGTASVIAWMESLAKGYASDEKVKKLLDSTTIHIWPRVNPDGAKTYFAKLRRETTTNDQPFDDDHDGLADEDGPDDLDGDGFITSMRIEDPDGEYILDSQEPRLLLKADRQKGERGAWRLLTEGRDNDGDLEWNEDSIGGVNFNRNFPFGFKFFAPGSGKHQVSEVETRALADFVIAHTEIGIVFTYGAADNLIQTPKGEAPKRPPVALHEGDVAWYRELGKAWREGLGIKKELNGATEPGTFSDWMYFHRGRLSLAARAWSPALQLELAKVKPKDEKPKDDASKKDGEAKSDGEKKSPEKGKEADTRNEEERSFLTWIDANATNAFVTWKDFTHPDFPGKKVQIGGFVPFAKTLPPQKILGDQLERQGRFLTDLAGKFPRVAIRKVEVKSLGESVFDITVHVENAGFLPTSMAQGGVTREVHPTRVVLKSEVKSLLSGTKTVMLDSIEPGGSKEARWVVLAKGLKQIEIEVVSMLGGRLQQTIELKEETK